MEVPGRWFRAYVQMMSRLEAQDALARISQIAAGNGLMEQRNQKQYLDQLRRAANGGWMPRPEAATSAALLGMHIAVETVEASEQTQRIARLQAEGGVLLGSPDDDDDGAGAVDLAAQLLG